jgi:hypothetical protein
VHGLPKIDQVNQLCDGFLVGKHQHTPFSEQAEYRAQQPLELVHGDLCWPITLPTPSGKKVFLLLVDDYSRYTWITLLPSKDCAPGAIKKLQAEAEVASGKKLCCMRTYRGGEFISTALTNHRAEMGVRR